MTDDDTKKSRVLPIADVLRAAASRVRRGWTQGVTARDADGTACAASSPYATCWSALGAINAAALGSITLASSIALAARLDGAL